MFAVQWHFGAFRLDTLEARLWRGEALLELPPKPFAVLQYLVMHPGRLVTKAELLDAVWPETAITDAVLRVAIGVVRRVLGDTAQTPRYIATVPRRGYRFLAPVTVSPASPSRAPGVLRPGGALPLLVAREAVLQRLHKALDTVQQGTRQVVLVTGEPGIGKTAVVDTFLAQAMVATPVWVAYGQCVASYGTGEAYLPILEALSALGKGPDGARLASLLRQQAPTWAAQLPWLFTAAQRTQLQAELQGATRERMLREGVEVLDTLSAERPLVLVLEDMHWSDHAMIDLLALLARRRTPARLLVLGTYRPGEVHRQQHPLQEVVPDWQRHGCATGIPLPGLSFEAVAAYLRARWPQHPCPDVLASWLHQRTEGHPLFLVTLVQACLAQGGLQTQEECGTAPGALATRSGEVPGSLRQVLEQQVRRLEPMLQRVLEVASVAGGVFMATAVAAGLEIAVEVVEAHCDTLVRQEWLHPLGVMTSPTGMVAACYTFRHALYQQASYARLGAGQRVRLHRHLGTWLEAAYGAQGDEIAAALATHFARGADTRRAVHYYGRAAEKAAQRYAPHEVIALVTHALTLLRQLPETPECAQQELALQMTLGAASIATQGQAAAEVAQAYTRAYALCQQLPDSPQVLQPLAGLVFFHIGQGAYQTAQGIGRHLLCLAQRLDEAWALLQAHGTLGISALYLGDLGGSRVHLGQGLALAESLAHGPGPSPAPWDMGVICQIGSAWALQLMGSADQALHQSHAALTRTAALTSPFNRCNLLFFLALFHCFRQEWGLATQWVEATLRLATAHGFPFYVAVGTIVRGATRVGYDQVQEGVADMQQGLAAWRILGTQSLQPWGLAMLAEGYGRLGQPEAGLAALAEAHAHMAATRETFYAAEIARLQGTLLVQSGAPAHDADPGLGPATPEACFQQALAVAHGQQAKWWELRAAMSLSRLWQQQGKRTEAYELLAPIYGWFTEGFDTADLQEAKALLDELGAYDGR